MIFLLKTAFKIAGFIFTVALPILMFGGVIPYTHGGKSAGFTTMGYIAVCIFLAIVAAKIRSKIKTRPESLKRGIFLSLFPLGAWIVVKLGVNKIVTLTANIAQYWDSVIIFVCLGCLFYIASEAMGERNNKE